MQLSFDDGRLLLEGKPRGKVSGAKVTIDDVSYDVRLEQKAGGKRRWDVVVKQADEVLLRGEAAHLCRGEGEGVPLAVAQELVRRRVVLYLGWRALLATKSSGPPGDPAPDRAPRVPARKGVAPTPSPAGDAP